MHSEGKHIAIASACPHHQFELFFQEHPEQKKLIDQFVSCDDVQAWKPDPKVFNEAMRRFGLEKSECVIFEDSFSGLTAARATGTAVVGVFLPGTETPEKRKLCDFAIGSYDDIKYE